MMIAQLSDNEVEGVQGGGLYELLEAVAAEIIREILENARPQV